MRQIYLPIIQFTALLVLMLASTTINADTFESMLMPGPVTDAHKKYEHDCEQCHDTSDKKKQAPLCMQCHAHENIQHDLSKKTGFHGRLPENSSNDCKHCHTEHEGRDAKIVLLNPSTFDHRKTDFLLKGTHKKTPCEACHKKGKKNSEAPGDCYSCHKNADVHKGKQGKKCGDCHKATSWVETGFDHDKTDFPLKGTHKDTSCNACHINDKYKDTPKDCFSCHQVNDVHRGNYGKKCETCHNPKKWDDASFDHSKTDFPLYGKHNKTACMSCHVPGDTRKELPTECYACHKNDDSHKGRYGKKCNDCHVSSSWNKKKFDHDKKTDFPLRGKHNKVACNSCHKGHLYKDELTGKCVACHKKDDAHKGEQGEKCDSCHNEKGWHSDVLFDHDLTSFPLIGMHAVTQCEECHVSAEYDKTEDECNSCHSQDDVHKTRLGIGCETCHTPNSWLIWSFDHDKDTEFALDGAHEELGCYDCHKTQANGKVQASKDCIFCHRSRDVHDRRFGRQCGRCHNTDSFKNATFR